jgi:hypothetical protein
MRGKTALDNRGLSLYYYTSLFCDALGDERYQQSRRPRVFTDAVVMTLVPKWWNW